MYHYIKLFGYIHSGKYGVGCTFKVVTCGFRYFKFLGTLTVVGKGYNIKVVSVW